MDDLFKFLTQFNAAAIAVAIALAVLSLGSCSTHDSVSDRQVHTADVRDTVYVTRISTKHDSIYHHDSVYLEVRGDTVRYTLYRDRYHFRYDTLHDTLYRERAVSTADIHVREHDKVVEKGTGLRSGINWMLSGAVLMVVALFLWRWKVHR